MDRLFILLDTGTTPVTRKAAAQQLGEVVKLHPHELNTLLTKVLAYLRSPSWDTRIAAGQAVEAIVRNIPEWNPAPKPKEDDLSPEDSSCDRLNFYHFDISRLLRHGASLLGSAGAEFELQDDKTEMDPKERLARQRKLLQKKLGLDMGAAIGMDTDELFNDEDLDYSCHPSSFKAPGYKAAAGCSSRNHVAAELIDSEFRPGMSSRQKNKAKRMAKLVAKHKSRDADPNEKNDGCEGEPEEKRRKTTNVVIDQPATEHKVLIDNVPDNSGLLEESHEWPLESFCEELCNDLFNPSWEVRHGAGTGLREILKSHGAGGGKLVGSTAQQMLRQHQEWIEDLVIRLLCVFALDRFGDFVSDEVVAPVRETCAQTLGVALLHMSETSVSMTVDVLLKLLKEDQWEVRHGGLLGIKYALAVRQDLISVLLPRVLPAITEGLQDLDDDVRAVAAAALIPVVEGLVQLLPNKKDAMHHVVNKTQGIITLYRHQRAAFAITSKRGPTPKAPKTPVTELPPGSTISPDNDECKKQFLVQRRGAEFALTTVARHFGAELNKRLPYLWDNTVGPLVTTIFTETTAGLNVKSKQWLALESKRQQAQSTVLETNGEWQQLHLRVHMFAACAAISLEALPDKLNPLVRPLMETVKKEENSLVQSYAASFIAKLLQQCAGRSPCPNSKIVKNLCASACTDPAATPSSACPVQDKTGLKARQGCNQVKETVQQYIAGAETVADDPLTRDYVVVRARLMAALLGALCRCICDPQLNAASQEIRPAESLGQLLLFHLNSKSALQRVAVALVLCEWAALQKDCQVVSSMVQPRLLAVLTEQLYYDEIAIPFTRMQNECKQLIALLAEVHVDLQDRLSCSVFTIDQANELVPFIVNTLWDALLDLDDLTASTNSIMTLLSLLLTFPHVRQCIEQSLTVLVPRVWPFLRHTISSVRKAALETLYTLLSKAEELQSCAVWINPILQDMLRHIFQSAILESNEEILELIQKVWMELLSQVPQQFVVSASCPWMGAWLCLMMQASHIPIDLNMLLEVKARSKRQAELERGDAAAQELVNSLQVLEVMAGAMAAELRPLLLEHLPHLFTCLQHPYTAVRHMTARCVGVLSKIATLETMNSFLECVLHWLAAIDDCTKQEGAIEALAVMEQLDVDIVPYIVLLVVPVLGRMSDPSDSIRFMATQCFATLIRLLPLEQAGIPDPPAMSADLIQQKARERQFLEQLLDGRKLENYKIPVPIKAELRKYQQDGVNWLAFLNKYKLHGILCDDMGLGKTLQSICILAGDHYLRAQEYAKTKAADCSPLPSLVVCPPTLTGHWVDEVAKFCSREYLSPLHYTGPPTERMLQHQVKKHNLVVASYDVVRNDIDFFNIKFNYCILDEGHIIKNGKTKLSKAIKQLAANFRVILSGTPIQNNVLELWSLFDFLMPGFLGTERQFAARYGKPILASRDAKSSSREQEAVLAMEALHRQVLPFLLRRMKEDVLQDLPPKIIQDYYCTLSPLQVQLYEDFAKSRAKASVEDSISVASSDEEEKPKLKATGHVFQALQYLRKLCNHPNLVLTPQHPEYKRITEQLACQNSNLRDIQHAPKLSALKQLLLDCGLGGGGGSEGGTEAVVAQHRVLIFCQLKSMLDIVEHDLLKPKLPTVTYLRLDGSVPAGQRHAIVSFNNDPSIDVLLLTTHVGGLGLNLTGADTVVFVEHDWNPMRDLQAMDRAHRIGQQKRVVNVYRLITRGTLEEKIMGLQKFKMSIANTIINQENSSLQSMGTDQLLNLFTLDTDDKGDRGEQSSSSSGKASIKSVLDGLGELWDQQQYDSEYNLDSFM
uniref:BTAF1 RNA polymerase II, B-TFIID transcription factor-associated n=1 Tax=Fundulus heteroclitus TaxID=8078 RepID=A0A3Q2QZV1_FUNHE